MTRNMTPSHVAGVGGVPTSTVEELDTRLAQARLVRTGPVEVMRRWFVSEILRVPTSHGAVWYKAVPRLFEHEGRITAWVGAHLPGVAPRVLASGNGWMITEEMPAEAPAIREHLLSTMSRVQRASLGHTAELVALGCPRRGLQQLDDDLQRMAERSDLLSDSYRRQLASILPATLGVIAAVAHDAIPDVLVHGDVQPDNVRWTDAGWMAIDWTDACVAHPFVELARPLMHASAEKWGAASRAVAAVWADLLPEPALHRALRAAPVIGAAHQAETYRRIADGVGRQDEFLQLLHQWIDLLATAVRAWTDEGGLT